MIEKHSPADGRKRRPEGAGARRARDLRLTLDGFERALARRGVALKRGELACVLAEAGSLRNPNALAALAAEGGLAPTRLEARGTVTTADGVVLVVGRDPDGNVVALDEASVRRSRFAPSPFGGIADLGALADATGASRPAAATAAPAPVPGRPAFVARVSHPGGPSVYVADTAEDIFREVARHVDARWAEAAARHRVLGSPEGLDEASRVSRYFAVVGGSYGIVASAYGAVLEAPDDVADEAAPTLGEPPEGVRVPARFQPQAWVNDYAVDVDPEGETEWDATDALRGMALERARSSLCGGDVDELASHPTAPGWVRAWSGPFLLTLDEGFEAWVEAAEARASA